MPQVKPLVSFPSCLCFVTPSACSLTLPSLWQTDDGNDDDSNEDVTLWFISGLYLALCYVLTIYVTSSSKMPSEGNAFHIFT